MSITGGKLLPGDGTGRRARRDAPDCESHGRGSHGTLPFRAVFGGLIAEAEKRLAALARHLAISHGAVERVGWIRRDADGRALVASGLPYTMGELRYSVANEMAQTLGDLLVRRTHVAFETRDHGAAAAERVAAAVAPQLGWTATDQRRAIEDYMAEVESVFGTH